MSLKAEEWLTEIDNALEYRKTFGRENSWMKNELNYYNDPMGDTAVGPNLVWSMGDSLLSSLGVPDPEIVTKAERQGGVDKAPVVEAIDNWLIEKLKMKRTVDDGLINAFLYSKAIVKIGYDSEYGYSPYWDIGQGNNLMGMTFTQFDKKGNRIEYKDTTPGMPWVGLVHPQDFVVPWGTVYIDDAPWVAHRFIRLNSYLKKDPKYKNTGRLQPQISMEDYVDTYVKVGAKRKRYRYQRATTEQQNKKPAFNICWEIHDRMTGKIMVVTEDYKKFLRDEKDVMQVCGLPFVAEGFVSHPRHFWSTPLSYYLGQIQHEQHDISIQAAKQRRLNVLRFLANKNVIDKDELDKWITGDVGAVGVIDGHVGDDLNKAIKAFPSIPDLTSMIESDNNRRNAREAVGMGRNQMGDEMQSSRRTKAEVDTVQQGSMTRTSKRATVVKNLYIDTMKKVNQVVFSFWNTPRSIQVGENWKRFTGDEIAGEYLLSLSLSSKRNVSRAQRKVEALMLMAQFAQMGLASEQLMQYVIDAANDPSFERILMPFMGKGGGGGGGAGQSASPAQPVGAK